MSKVLHLKDLVNNAKKNRENATEEIRKLTVSVLEDHYFDNLQSMIENATERGFVAVEWITFEGISSIDMKMVIQWATKVIRRQGLKDIVEPYYNNQSNRLGICLLNSYLEKEGMLTESKFITLPLEIRK